MSSSEKTNPRPTSTFHPHHFGSGPTSLKRITFKRNTLTILFNPRSVCCVNLQCNRLMKGSFSGLNRKPQIDFARFPLLCPRFVLGMVFAHISGSTFPRFAYCSAPNAKTGISACFIPSSGMALAWVNSRQILRAAWRRHANCNSPDP